MRRNALIAGLAALAFALGVAVAQQIGQQPLQLRTPPPNVSRLQIDGTYYVIYPVVVRTIDSGWTSAFVGVDPAVLLDAERRYHAYRDSVEGAR
jgi:hypothetical protein